MARFIVIDDEAIFHKIVQMTLKFSELSGSATYCYDGQMVLDFLEENKSEGEALPDYIFVDLYMPRFTGWDFLNGFQQIYQSLKKKISIYVISSSVDPRDVDRSKTYPFVTTFISKPVMREIFDGMCVQA